MLNPERQREYKRFIQAPGMWPNWPMVPIKRRGPAGSECAVLCDTQPIGCKMDPEHVSLRTAILFNMFDDPKKIKSAERKVYATVDELLADGWYID